MTEDIMKEPPLTVVQWISLHQAKHDVSNADLALSAGVAENAMRMIKEGKVKLPFGAIKGLAKCFDAAPRELLEVVLNEYSPELRALIEDMRMPLDITEHERELLRRYRVISKGRDAVPVIVSGITLIAPKSR